MQKTISTKKIKKVIEFLTSERNFNDLMADRMIKRYPHLKGGLGENITQADYNNSNHINYHLGTYSGYRKGIEELSKLIK